MADAHRLRFGAAILAGILALAASVRSERQPSSGLDLSSLDRSVRPQDDLYRFANGRWLDRAEIPPDRVSTGTFTELAARVELDLRRIIQGIDDRGGDARRIRDLYDSLLNEERIEAVGSTPLDAELARIDAVTDADELARQIGRLSALGDGGPFATSAGVDAGNPSALIITVTQGGTLLPERRYYRDTGAHEQRIRHEYIAYLEKIFRMTGREQPGVRAREVLALETRLAEAQLPVGHTSPELLTLHEAARAMPGFSWREWAKPQGFDRAKALLFEQAPFFRAFAASAAQVPLATWKAWLAARYITAVSIFLPERFADARFHFFGRILSGQEVPLERWKRGVSLVNGYLGDAMGRLYVRAHFPESSRRRVQAIVERILEAARLSLAEAEWMTRGARRHARGKVDALEALVGHPDRWRRYDGLVVSPDDLFGNVQRARQFENAYHMRRLRRRTEPREWLRSPQTVNAYYAPSRNEIVLPAAMLQPPLFDPAAEDAVNYGAIGAMIGHEISHAFDARGRRFDGQGRAADWWTEDDERAYQRLARPLVEQFDAYAPVPGASVDGRLTFAENAADLAGLGIALRGYRLSLGGRPAPELDGFTGEQRLFIKWAQVWREKAREEYVRQSLRFSPHAPAEYRANGAVSHLPAFYDAFNLGRGDKLYREARNRVRIW